MAYEDRGTYGMYKGHDEKGSGSRLIGGLRTPIAENVCNHKGEDLGDRKESVSHDSGWDAPNYLFVRNAG